MISIIIVQWSVDITTNMSSYFFLRSWWIWVCCLVVTLCICISGKSCGTSCLWGGFKFLLMFFSIFVNSTEIYKTPTPKKKTLLSNKWKKTKLYNEGPVRWALMYMGSYGPFEKKWKLIWRQYIEEEFFKVKWLFGVVCHIAENVKSSKLLI